MYRARMSPLNVLFHEVNSVQEEFSKLFNRLSNQPAAGPLPALNLWEDEHSLYADIDLPGIDPAKLDVTVTEGNQLTVQGERAAPQIGGSVWVRQERPSGNFVRSVSLPVLVDPDKVSARYEQGVLSLTLPKSEAAKPRKISVKAGE